MNNTLPNGPRRRMRSLLTKGTAVLAASATLAGPGATAALAAEPSPGPGPIFREVIKPSDSIRIPSMQCPTGYLHNVNYAPGRLVPPGVEVSEPGGVGVTIASEAKYATVPGLGEYMIGFESGGATATNWDPGSSHELKITLHCTDDRSKAVRKETRLGPRP